MTQTDTPLTPWNKLDFIYSSLCFQGKSRHSSWSSQNVIAHATSPPNQTIDPTIKNENELKTSQITTIVNTPNVDVKDFPCNPIPVDIANRHHENHKVIDFVWNQRGACLASIDEAGKIVLWENKTYINEWECIYETNFEQPVIRFEWLQTDRNYQIKPPMEPEKDETQMDTSEDDAYHFSRTPFKGPRNPYGHLAFLVVLASGRIVVHFQHEGTLFSKLEASLPYFGGKDGDGNRISHCDIVLTNDGKFLLAVYQANSQTKMLSLFEVTIQFLAVDPALAIQCQAVAKLHLSDQAVDSYFLENPHCSLLHLKILPPGGERNTRILIITGKDQGTSDAKYVSRLYCWELKETVVKLHSAFQSIVSAELENPPDIKKWILEYVCDAEIKDAVVTCVVLLKSDQRICLGLSNGNLELRDSFSLNSVGYTKILDHNDNQAVFPLDCCTSPNEVYLLVLDSKRQFRKLPLDIISDPDVELYTDHLSRQMALCILNNIDPTDLIEAILRLAKETNDKKLPEKILQKLHVVLYTASEKQEITLDLALIRRIYATQFLMFKYANGKPIQYINIYLALQFQFILESFMASCREDLEEINTYLEENTKDLMSKAHEFDPETIKSLLPLVAWVLDACVFILRNTHSFFNISGPPVSTTNDSTETSANPSHMALYYCSNIVFTIRKVLFLISGLKLHIEQNNSEAYGEYLKSINDIITKRPFQLGDLQNYFGQVSTIVAEKKASSDINRHEIDSIAISESVVPSPLKDSIQQIQDLFKERFGENFEKSNIFFYDLEWLELREVDKSIKFKMNSKKHFEYAKGCIDVVRKCRLLRANHISQCKRCLHYSAAEIDENVPHESLTPWQAMFRKACVCGGSWELILPTALNVIGIKREAPM
ncbi:hypothetical protein K7432_000426 [Basidiobolus ranarum]|uniref:Mediator of RNA polymerase II transcription subunit 16 n=1 Tax=Basidiobolus ranarum TaxID=34480 RepID=A0ABR2WB79_9FUNG